jgi:enamine deaminase RidA (YjgF/YER057c/UK114 family)
MIRLHDLDLSAPSAPSAYAARTLWAQRLGAPPGSASGGDAFRTASVCQTGCALPPLADFTGVPVDDVWLAGAHHGDTLAGQTGAVRWRQRGGWLAAAVDLPEVDDGEGLQALAGAAYDALFAVLRARGTPHVLRFWNYMARINDEVAGLERYRHFNLGRQQAFDRARRSAFEGSPAASAVGSPPGAPLQVRVIASASPVSQPVENPRQVSAYRYPSAYGPVAPSFSRAALLARGDGGALLAWSGTASIVGHASVHVGDAHAQTLETCRNLDAVLAAARAMPAGRPLGALAAASLTVYVRHPPDAPAVAQALAAYLGADAPALAHAVWLQADICRAELLVEIEGVLSGAALG